MSYELTLFNINDQKVFARVEGKEDRQVVLLIHGWSSSWYAMSPLMPLFNRRFRAMAVDLPGYGESPPLKERASMEAYADLLAELLKSVTDKPAILVGHSMGGMISLTLALRHPELVERLVLICPTISGRLSLLINSLVGPVVLLERSFLTRKLVEFFDWQMIQISDWIIKPASLSERSDVSETEYAKIRADARRLGQGRVRAQCYWAMRHGDLRGKLAEVDKIPMLTIWGMDDNTVPLRDASVIIDECPSVDLRVIPKASHWPQFEAPVLTRRYISAFIGTPLKLLEIEF